MIVLILIILSVIYYALCVSWFSAKPRGKHGGAYDLSAFGECEIESTYEANIDRFLLSNKSSNPTTTEGCFINWSERIACVLMPDYKRNEENEIEYYKSFPQNFAGISSSASSSRLAVFFDEIKGSTYIPKGHSDVYRLVVKFNQHSFSEDKKFIAIEGTGSHAVEVLETESGVINVVPIYLKERKELPAPRIGFYNLTGNECYFNSALEFLLRMGDVSLSEHPDLVWLRNARKYYKQKASSVTNWRSFEEEGVNQEFVIANVTEYDYIKRKNCTFFPTLETVERDGPSIESADLGLQDDPVEILRNVLYIASVEESYMSLTGHCFIRCSVCNHELTITDPLIDSDSWMLKVSLYNNSNPTFSTHELFDIINGIAHETHSGVFCTTCGTNEGFKSHFSSASSNINNIKYLPCSVLLAPDSTGAIPKIRNFSNIVIGSSTFNVVAIIGRSGAYTLTSGGHYVSFVKKGPNWYYLNDDRCTTLPSEAQLITNLDAFAVRCLLLERI